MDLKTMIDEREIARRLAQFARLLDGRRYADIGEVFAGDVRFDYGVGGEQTGIAALRALFARFLDSCGPTQHLLGSVLIDVDGDDAVSRAYVQARHQRGGDPSGAVFDTNGEYVDRWERRPEGWRIVRRDSHWSIFSGDGDVLASLGTGATTEPAA